MSGGSKPARRFASFLLVPRGRAEQVKEARKVARGKLPGVECVCDALRQGVTLRTDQCNMPRRATLVKRNLSALPSALFRRVFTPQM